MKRKGATVHQSRRSASAAPKISASVVRTAAVLAMSAASLPQTASATDKYWAGPDQGLWQVPTNWSPSGAPAAGWPFRGSTFSPGVGAVGLIGPKVGYVRGGSGFWKREATATTAASARSRS